MRMRQNIDMNNNKTLYSLLLSEDVVRAVDGMAHRMGMSRSALVNRILAEYVSLETPENRIDSILKTMEDLLSPSEELIPFFAPNSKTMSLKSSLAYKYRPTVRYEVDLDPNLSDQMGTLSVIFRTQSAALINDMTEFFKLWVRIESATLEPIIHKEIEYALYDGKFVRPLLMPDIRNLKSDAIAESITDYINLFDKNLKAYLAGSITEYEVAANYRNHLINSKIYV